MFHSIFSSSPSNSLILGGLAEAKEEDSIRLTEFILHYQLKYNELFHLNPLLRKAMGARDSETCEERDCIAEMNDLEINYKKERKKQFERIREVEAQEQKQLLDAHKQSLGFIGKIFQSLGSSKSKQSRQTKSLIKRSVYESPSKSMSYMSKDSSTARKQSVSRPKSDTRAPDTLLQPENSGQDAHQHQQPEVNTFIQQQPVIEPQAEGEEIELEDLLNGDQIQSYTSSASRDELARIEQVAESEKSQNNEIMAARVSSRLSEPGIPENRSGSFHRLSESSAFNLSDFQSVNSGYNSIRQEVETGAGDGLLDSEGNSEINRMIKLEALDLQEKVIIKRMYDRWNQLPAVFREMDGITFEKVSAGLNRKPNSKRNELHFWQVIDWNK